MDRLETTIAAQATPSGSGGIAIVRISGPSALEILRRLFRPSRKITAMVPWCLHHGTCLDCDGQPIDDVLAVYMPGPHTFTGDDTAEIHCHGGMAIVHEILEACFAVGCVPAERGEFSRRAFLNGRFDLSQAEAVAEMIAAPNREAMRYSLKRLSGALGVRVKELRTRLEGLRVHMSLAVDFPDDEVECLPRQEFLSVTRGVADAIDQLIRGHSRAHLVQKGATIVLAGSVNAGKSSLMNALLGRNRALVTDIPGTTRDFLEETLDFDGLPVRLVDTAGLRETSDPVESLGVARSRQKMDEADFLLMVVDGAQVGNSGAQNATCPDETIRNLLARDVGIPALLVWNKSDICTPKAFPPLWCQKNGTSIPAIAISALTGEHIDDLVATVKTILTSSLPQVTEELAPNERQALALKRAQEELELLVRDIEAGQLYDLLSVRLDVACAELSDVIGLGTSGDVLNAVFSSFCIGK